MGQSRCSVAQAAWLARAAGGLEPGGRHVRSVYNVLFLYTGNSARISIFTSLPLTSVGRLALQERLDEIGRAT